jgi:hypothetical protein
MERSRYWVVDGICQVCLGDCYQHLISSECGTYWCDASELVEIGLQVKGE